METITSSKATFKNVDGQDDIILAEFIEPVNLDLEEAVKIVNHRLAFTRNKKHYLVVDASKVVSVSKDAKKYFQEPENGLKNILGAALIASNPLAALIANIFIKTPADFQSRFFSNAVDALNWIYDQKSNGADQLIDIL